MFLSVFTKKAVLIIISLFFLFNVNASSKLSHHSKLKYSFLLDSKISVLKKNETHADLKLIDKLYSSENFKVEFEFKVTRQYRKPANPWETCWFFWSYNLDGNEKKLTNYIVFKSNEIEIGKAFDEVGQEFIFTKNTNYVDLTKWQKIKLIRIKKSLTLIWNKNQIQITENYLNQLYPYPGKIGLYTEDAKVEIKNFQISH